MSTVAGLPAHVLFVHFIVVLAPLTAGLLAVCSVWPAARRRLVWPVLVLASAIAVLTPVTAEAGEWLEEHVDRSAAVHTHTELGATMIYFSAALLLAAVGVTILHLRERPRPSSRVLTFIVAGLVIVVAVATSVQVYRIGESGSRAVWGDSVSAAFASQ